MAMNIVELTRDYATLVNSLALILLLVKLAADSHRQRLEREKLERELTILREGEADATARILQATAADLNNQVLGPLVESMRKRDKEIEESHRRLVEAFYTAADRIRENSERRDKALEDGHRRVLEAFYGAAASIRENTDKAALGGKLSALIQENTRTLEQLRERLSLPARETKTPSPIAPSGN
jgi:hypothetical protein